MKKILILLTLMLSLAFLPAQAQAGSSLRVVLEDSLWGAAIGTLLGGATLAFMDHPSDHYERLAQGASIGLVGGMAFGIYEISPVFYTMEGSKPDEMIYGLGVSIPIR